MECSTKTNQKINLLQMCQRCIIVQHLRNRTHPRNTRISLKLNLHGKLSGKNMTAYFIRNTGKIVARILHTLACIQCWNTIWSYRMFRYRRPIPDRSNGRTFFGHTVQ